MNWVEIVGAVAGLIYLYYQYHANFWLWIWGLVMPLIYIYLFFDSGFYANALLNVYYVGMSIYGIINWRRNKKEDEGKIQSMPRRYWLPLILILVALTAAFYFILGSLNESQAPLLDGASTALSVVGMWMLSRKYYQEWFCWILSEPILIAMSIVGHLYATAIMYTIYLVVAIMGYYHWKKIYRSQS